MIKKEEWMEIRNLKNQGLTKSAIARRLGIDRKTVYNNLAKEHIPKYKREVTCIRKIDSYKRYIEEILAKKDVTAEVLFREIKVQGYTGSYSILASYVSNIKEKLRYKAVMRFETLPGEQAQVDWGYMGEIYDTELQRTVKVNCFVAILGYSRMRFIKFYTDAKLDNFLEGHNSAFKYFGGYSKEILYDNLKSVVIKRALKAEESEFNKKFMDYSGYYGFKPILCRPYKPCTKGKVEKTVDYVKRNFYALKKFRSISEMNALALEWLNEINSTTHATTHERPLDRLAKENLISIDNKKLYDLTFVSYRQVHIDCHFSFETNRYSVPYEYAGKEVAIVKDTENIINVKYRDKIIASHKIQNKGKYSYVTINEHISGLNELRIKYSNAQTRKEKRESSFIEDAALKEDVNNRNLSVYEEVFA